MLFDLIHIRFEMAPVVLDYYEHIEANKLKLNVDKNKINCPLIDCLLSKVLIILSVCAGDQDKYQHSSSVKMLQLLVLTVTIYL